MKKSLVQEFRLNALDADQRFDPVVGRSMPRAVPRRGVEPDAPLWWLLSALLLVIAGFVCR